VIFQLSHAQARQRATEAVQKAPDGYVVKITEPTRNLEQNALLWVYLGAFADQLVWPVNGRMVKMLPADWKHVLSAAFRKEQARLAMGLDGGVVMLGSSTSQMGKREFAEFLDFVSSVAADRGVMLDDTPNT
jgi:NinB protein